MKTFKIEPGEEVMDCLQKQLKASRIESGAIVSIIGAVDACCISNMPKHDAKQDFLTEYREPLEMSGCGEIENGKPHIHCVFGREGDTTLSGHLHWAKVDTWFVKVFVISG